MAAKRWNSETTIKFIQEFKSYECLWNQKSHAYKNKHAREAAFQKVVDEMNITGFGVPEAKIKMRALRSTYYQEKKKIENSKRSGSGSDTLYVPNIPWYKEMDGLLKDIDERRTTIKNVNNSANSEMHDVSIVGSASDTQETASEDLNLTISSVPEEIHGESSRSGVKSGSKRKGIFRAIGELKKLHEAINSEVPVPIDTADRFDIFGKSVAMQLRTLSFERGMIGQARIQNILTELAIENYRCEQMPVCTDTSTSSERSTPGFNMLHSGYSGDNILSDAIATLQNHETQ